jgi:hypothetical protein
MKRAWADTVIVVAGVLIVLLVGAGAKLYEKRIIALDRRLKAVEAQVDSFKTFIQADTLPAVKREGPYPTLREDGIVIQTWNDACTSSVPYTLPEIKP